MSDAGYPQEKPKWPGPVARVEWIFNDETRVAAKQAEMLTIDLRAFSRWAESMEALIAEELSDKEFTGRRMDALKAWEKDRKRAQRNLHYKYDPRRRDPARIERDIRAIRIKLAKQRVELDTHIARRQANVWAMPEEVDPAPAKARRPRVEKPLVRRDLPELPFLRSLNGVDEAVIEMVKDAAGIEDLTGTTDDELWTALVEHGIPTASTQMYIDALNAGQS
ncbi:hypothetical protein [Lacisediminihabitans profunda]|uniref:Uncharacterized protein n=1 Tax=Lacisediminihabitans profunda TaxID=2594790 RepID=A0A5C8UN61_9MICO|nr:hypothetical protein [Lacisediminihabitans profunda]TXN29308.1 hypothetical protein FVP33_14105 [Lacisediminihabitans profunda]